MLEYLFCFSPIIMEDDPYQDDDPVSTDPPPQTNSALAEARQQVQRMLGQQLDPTVNREKYVGHRIGTEISGLDFNSVVK